MINKEQFKGIIIKESISDVNLLDYLEQIAYEIYEHKLGGSISTTIYKVIVEKNKIDELSYKISKALLPKGYYAHFVLDKQMIVVFPNMIFKFNKSDNKVIEKCVKYGESIEIDSNMMNFEKMFEKDHPNNKNVVIFGGSGDLGKEFIYTFLNNGYSVYSTYCKNQMNFPGVKQYYFDAEKNNKDFYNKINKIEINTLIFCIGTRSSKKNIVDTSYFEFNRLLRINALSFLNIYRNLSINLRSNKSKILVVSSSASIENKVTNGAYSASKAYLDSIVETLKKEEVQYGVEFKVIHPSLFKSKLAEEIVKMKGYDNFDYYVREVLNGEIKFVEDIVKENKKFLKLTK